MSETHETYPFTEASKDFRLMADALRFLGDHWQDRPDYGDAARRAGLSPHHFHKIFTRWAGVSPKRYVDSLAFDEARSVLAGGGTVEEASYQAGLSAPSRLHDLCIRHEALSPGEAASKAKGVKFVWGAADSPFGRAVALISPRGLSALAFCAPGEEDAALDDFFRRYPLAAYRRDDAQAAGIIHTVFSGGVLPIALYGTPFQMQVWKALLAVGPGETVRYMDIANAIERPKAVRAVGAAIGANPISWVIPCHRILGADRRLTGYHWGLECKRAMLAFENIRTFGYENSAR